MLLRLARTYKIDMADLAGDGGADDTARMQAVLKDPMFADIDMPGAGDQPTSPTNYPGITEALLRLYTAYREEQLALADRARRRWRRAGTGADGYDANDPVAEVRRFLAARRNNFPTLDDAAERLAQAVGRARRLRRAT